MYKFFKVVLGTMIVGLLLAACGNPSRATKLRANNVTMYSVLAGLPHPLVKDTVRPGVSYGIDFGWNSISAYTAKSMGVKFAASYLSGTSKDWSRALVNAYHSEGIATVAVWETTANRSEDGYEAGVVDAHRADVEARSLGDTGTIFFAVDCDCSGSSIRSYFEGVHAVLGSREGAYGGYGQVGYLHASGLVGPINFQTYAWSYGRWLPASIAPLEQYNLGSHYDLDRAFGSNYGQWPYSPPKPPRPVRHNVKLVHIVHLHTRMHYENYATKLKFGVHGKRHQLNERYVVATWDWDLCTNPVKRHVCINLRKDMVLLRERILSMHHHGHSWRYGSPSSIGVRNQQLYHRLKAHKQLSSWKAGV